MLLSYRRALKHLLMQFAFLQKHVGMKHLSFRMRRVHELLSKRSIELE